MRPIWTWRHRSAQRVHALSSWTRKESCRSCFDSWSCAGPSRAFLNRFCHRRRFSFWRHREETADQENVSIDYLKRFERIAGQRGRNRSINRSGDKMSERRIYDLVTSFSPRCLLHHFEISQLVLSGPLLSGVKSANHPPTYLMSGVLAKPPIEKTDTSFALHWTILRYPTQCYVILPTKTCPYQQFVVASGKIIFGNGEQLSVHY